MDYPLMTPPFNMKPFIDLNKKEAKQYFEWYVSQIPERIAILKQVSNGQILLDYSEKSLIPLFTWFLSTVTVYQLSEEEIEAKLEDLRQYPDFAFEDAKEQLLANPVELKKEDYALAMDIAIYYAETLIKNYPQVHWTYLTKSKSHIHLNEPILDVTDDTGFLKRDPNNLLMVLIEYIKENDIKNTTLYEMFLMDVDSILGKDLDDE
ncbi:hypothetical protein [Kurthia zopfii]|uniref:hypothetical protein n=1 Tax=Kurthia zopfii TaxID=1650 RepID=UPI000F6BDD38|nr:hypothetical protein [Kurthia zopfii]VEI08747.1 Uncharacterised protein [Kurthia zopfii]